MFNLFDDLLRIYRPIIGHKPLGKVYVARFTDCEPKIETSTAHSCGAYIDSVVFNGTATIVKWNDGVVTRSVCHKDDKFDAEKGLAMAIAKRHLRDAGVEKYEDFFNNIINNKENYVKPKPKQKKQNKKQGNK